MAPQAKSERVSASELEEGDRVLVHVNRRAAEQLGKSKFEAMVVGVSFNDIRFRPTEELQEESDSHTWYSDIGYIHGYHEGIGRHTDIGKVSRVERVE